MHQAAPGAQTAAAAAAAAAVCGAAAAWRQRHGESLEGPADHLLLVGGIGWVQGSGSRQSAVAAAAVVAAAAFAAAAAVAHAPVVHQETNNYSVIDNSRGASFTTGPQMMRNFSALLPTCAQTVARKAHSVAPLSQFKPPAQFLLPAPACVILQSYLDPPPTPHPHPQMYIHA